MTRRAARGFTLLELVVTLGVVGVLSGVVVLISLTTRGSVRASSVTAALVAARGAEDDYAASGAGFATTSATTASLTVRNVRLIGCDGGPVDPACAVGGAAASGGTWTVLVAQRASGLSFAARDEDGACYVMSSSPIPTRLTSGACVPQG